MRKKKDEFLEYCLNEVKKGGYKKDLQLLDDKDYCPTLLFWDSAIEQSIELNNFHTGMTT